jgi:hypothetical protein
MKSTVVESRSLSHIWYLINGMRFAILATITFTGSSHSINKSKCLLVWNENRTMSALVIPSDRMISSYGWYMNHLKPKERERIERGGG